MYKTIDYEIYPVEITILASEYVGVFSIESIINMHEAGLQPFEIEKMIELYLHNYRYMGYSESDFLCMVSKIQPIIIYDVEKYPKQNIKHEAVPNSKAYRIQNKNKRHY